MIGWCALNDVEKKPAQRMTGQRREKLQARVSGDSFQNATESLSSVEKKGEKVRTPQMK